MTFFIARVVVNDEQAYKDFGRKVQPLYDKHQARFLVKRNKAKALMIGGATNPRQEDIRLVIAEFPSEKAVQDFMENVQANDDLRKLLETAGDVDAWCVESAMAKAG